MKRIHYGFTLGINYMDYNMWFRANTPIRGEVAIFEPGLSVGLISNLKINDYFSFRITPGFVFGGRKITFSQPEDAKIDSYSGSILAECPFLLKLSSERYGNNRAYLIGGVNLKYDIISENSLHPEEMVFTRNNSFDYSIEFGVGMDFYMPFFKLSTELRISLGLTDVLNHEKDKNYEEYYKYTEGIEKMNSKIVSLLFHFE